MIRLAIHAGQARSFATLLAGLAAIFAASACASSTGPNIGVLTVTITAPSGVTPNVTVRGPNGFARSLSASATLRDLVAGSYVVTAASITVTGPIVNTTYAAAVSGSPASVSGSPPSATTVRYARVAGSGALWIGVNQPVGSFVSSIVSYTSSQLTGGSSQQPATTIVTPQGAYGAAFDASGNLWVPLLGLFEVVEYSATQLDSSGTPEPIVTLASNGGSLIFPASVAFDAAGNLWVTNFGVNVNTVVEFAASQLVASGNPTPAVTIGAANGSLNDPFGIAFDTHGNLWVTNSGAGTVVEYSPGQLAQTGTPTPVITLTPPSIVFTNPQGLAFDTHGNLWIACGGSNTIVELAASQLTSTSAPDPAVFLTAINGSLDDPAGVAFDNSGNLWVSNFQSSASVVEFTKNQLASSGSPEPTIIGAPLNGPVGMAFNPHAAGLPLKP